MEIVRHEINDFSELDNLIFSFNKVNKTLHCNNIVTMDIETSNGYLKDGKYQKYGEWVDKTTKRCSLMYIWQVAVECEKIHVFFGRTYEDFKRFIDRLTTAARYYALTRTPLSLRLYDLDILKTRQTTVIHAYIHNLGFEFQHFRNAYNDKFAGHVFARSLRKPMYAYINNNRCKFMLHDTLSLTQKSLDAWGKDAKLAVQKIKEPEGFYDPIRTPETKLSDDMLDYCTNDVVTMVYGMQQYREKWGSLQNIPLTQTGEVRRKCKEKIGEVNTEWAEHCKEITANYDDDFVHYLEAGFYGGWTHSNAMYTDKVLHDIHCYDFASSYPAVMCRKLFPIGKPFEIDPSDIEIMQAKGYATLATYSFDNLQCIKNNTYLSYSRAIEISDKEDVEIDNGRVYYAKFAEYVLTDLDFEIVKQDYSFDNLKIRKVYAMKYGRLPKEFVTTILEYFQYKTKLKGNEEMESLYNESKQFINSIYGDAVKKLICDNIEFKSDGWNSELGILEDPGKNEVFYTMYQIGVWVTAWARFNLWCGILALDDYIAYCDTDSIKGIFTEEQDRWFEEFNEQIIEENKKAAEELGIDPALFEAYTPKGNKKILGVFEREDDYVKFKTLGAKRYCCETKDGKIHVTVAGLPHSAAPELIHKVEDFCDELHWDPNISHKNTHYYLDEQPDGQVWLDEFGNEFISDDKYGIVISPTSFDMSMSDEYIIFLECLDGDRGIQREYGFDLKKADIT